LRPGVWGGVDLNSPLCHPPLRPVPEGGGEGTPTSYHSKGLDTFPYKPTGRPGGGEVPLLGGSEPLTTQLYTGLSFWHTSGLGQNIPCLKNEDFNFQMEWFQKMVFCLTDRRVVMRRVRAAARPKPPPDLWTTATIAGGTTPRGNPPHDGSKI